MKNLVLTAVLTVVLLSASLQAQNLNSDYKVSTTSTQLDERAISDLTRGIKSENIGLRRSSIFLAGYYGVKEVSDALITRLEVEEDENTRILIALSLFKMGSEEGLDAVKELSLKDDSAKVRRMSAAILKESAGSETFYSVINSLR